MRFLVNECKSSAEDFEENAWKWNGWILQKDLIKDAEHIRYATDVFKLKLNISIDDDSMKNLSENKTLFDLVWTHTNAETKNDIVESIFSTFSLIDLQYIVKLGYKFETVHLPVRQFPCFEKVRNFTEYAKSTLGVGLGEWLSKEMIYLPKFDPLFFDFLFKNKIRPDLCVYPRVDQMKFINHVLAHPKYILSVPRIERIYWISRLLRDVKEEHQINRIREICGEEMFKMIMETV